MPEQKRRKSDDMLEEMAEHIKVLTVGVSCLLSMVDIDIEDSPEKMRESARAANKDFRFLRSLRNGTANSAIQVRRLSIAGGCTAFGLLFFKGWHNIFH